MFRGGGNSEPLARCVFAGGTSLVSAWAITERYSEDLDLLVLTVEQRPTNSAAKRALGVPTGWVASSLNLLKEEIDTRHMGNVGFRRSHLEIGGEPGFLKIETTVEPTDDALFKTRTVTSLLGRFATSDDLDHFPELGGFEMPCVVPGYTAANSFEFQEQRNRLGDLVLLPKDFNASYGDMPYEEKVHHYYGQNPLAQSLHPMTYENNPSFRRLRETYGLAFQAYPESFKKADIEARQELYMDLAKVIWDPARLDLIANHE